MKKFSEYYKSKKEAAFEPHVMYDADGKAHKAETEADHTRMAKLGYTHEKPEVNEVAPVVATVARIGARWAAKQIAKRTAKKIATNKDEVAEAKSDEKYDKCWDGYKKVPGKKRGEDGSCEKIDEAEYKGRKVTLNKPMKGDVKKSKVYVDPDGDGKATKVNFGHGGTSAKKAGEKTMRIRKSNPERRKSFRARHNCDNPGPKDKARYWSCKAW
jgi:hypothetical protein